MKTLLFSLLLTSPCLAHDAPSGWTYPVHCCSQTDCHQIDESALEEYPNYWVIRATKELFLKPEIDNSKAGIPSNAEVSGVATYSPDGLFHRCSGHNGAEDGVTYCLFVPRPAT